MPPCIAARHGQTATQPGSTATAATHSTLTSMHTQSHGRQHRPPAAPWLARASRRAAGPASDAVAAHDDTGRPAAAAAQPAPREDLRTRAPLLPPTPPWQPSTGRRAGAGAQRLAALAAPPCCGTSLAGCAVR